MTDIRNAEQLNDYTNIRSLRQVGNTVIIQWSESPKSGIWVFQLTGPDTGTLTIHNKVDVQDDEDLQRLKPIVFHRTK